jgi:hypothetical protein
MGTGWSKLPGGREVEVLREGVSEVKLAMLSFLSRVHTTFVKSAYTIRDPRPPSSTSLSSYLHWPPRMLLAHPCSNKASNRLTITSPCSSSKPRPPEPYHQQSDFSPFFGLHRRYRGILKSLCSDEFLAPILGVDLKKKMNDTHSVMGMPWES